MFTGLVQSLAAVNKLVPVGPGVRLVIDDATTAEQSAIGDSIAINGCCLTVVGVGGLGVGGPSLAFDAGKETLERTNLGELVTGSKVNLENSMSLSDSLDGHLVTGHIDGVGTVDRRLDDQEWSTLWFQAPKALMRQMASKGSIAVDGNTMRCDDMCSANDLRSRSIKNGNPNATNGRVLCSCLRVSQSVCRC